MRLINLIIIVLVSFILLEYAHAGKRYRDDENNDDTGVKNKQKSHEYKKYDKLSNEDISKGKNSFEKKNKKHKWKPTDDEESSEEIQLIQYRKKDKDKKKKTLGDVFQEKKQKKQEKKQRFEKNVLKYFKNSNEVDEKESSEEIIAPIRRKKTVVDVDCDSSEERCD